jgi:hypothetical protein
MLGDVLIARLHQDLNIDRTSDGLDGAGELDRFTATVNRAGFAGGSAP